MKIKLIEKYDTCENFMLNYSYDVIPNGSFNFNSFMHVIDDNSTQIPVNIKNSMYGIWQLIGDEDGNNNSNTSGCNDKSDT